MNRRNFIKSLAFAGVSIPLVAAAKQYNLLGLDDENATPIVTSWKDGSVYKTGIMDIKNGQLSIVSEARIPSRAHEVIYEGNGQWLVVDRIPGDWLARYNLDGQMQIVSIGSERIRFAGHMKKSLDGKYLYTMEYDKPTGQSIVGVRDIKTLEKIKEYRTGRTDPHSMILDDKGDIWVSNGGIPKHIDPNLQDIDIYPVESAISHIDHKTGKLVNEWMLGAKNLSIRHLAWGMVNGQKVLGGSIKASHKTIEERERAPVLAILKDGKLSAVDFKLPYQGYAGDIVFANGCFYLSCTWANKIAVFNPTTNRIKDMEMFESCALKVSKQNKVIYAGTRSIAIEEGFKEQPLDLQGNAQGITFENHVDLCTDFDSLDIKAYTSL